MKWILLLLFVPLLASMQLGGMSQVEAGRPQPPPFLLDDARWADSVMQGLNTHERIAQLMMVAAYSNKDAAHEKDVDRLIREHNIGGLIFFQGGPVRQAVLTNRYQAAARTPLLVGMDLEWGLAMRLDSTIRFPKQMTLGALPEETGIREMGQEIARQMTRLGVQVSFSPVADVNNNPSNPVINDRSFGEDRENVARKAIAYMQGLQDGGVIATAKHFPGHGDTDVDSHKALPVIAHSRMRLDSLELYPFQRLMEEGLSAIMVAHLEVPALDSTPHTPSTLSRPIVNELLTEELGFKGLVFTDALNMKGVTGAGEPGDIELRALLAGNDVLLFPADPEKAIARIERAVAEGELSQKEIDRKCLKVLRAKHWAGLSKRPTVQVKNITKDLFTPHAQSLRRELYGDAITVLRNTDELLPLRPYQGQRIASVIIGEPEPASYQALLDRHARISHFTLEKEAKDKELQDLLEKLKVFDVVLVSVHHTSYRASKQFGIPDRVFEVVKAINKEHRTIFSLYANPYRMLGHPEVNALEGLIIGYEDEADVHDQAVQAIFGARGTTGHLPVTVPGRFAMNAGVETRTLDVLSYGLPEDVGMASTALARMDDIVQEGIAAKAYPGCQVLVARKGEVIWEKAYGKPTYDAEVQVRTTDLYDLASITKVAATTLVLMSLVDDGTVDLNGTLGDHLPQLRTTHPEHASLKVRDMLTHQAGLKDWIPFYKKLMVDKRIKPGVFTEKPDAEHALRVAERMYIDPAYTDSLRSWMLSAAIDQKKEYKYSDLGMLLMQWVIENRTGKTLDAVVEERFYRPLGLNYLGYRPLERFPKKRIVPTEYDAEFRQQQVWGDVHDPAAAMLGGVAGHAGLFSNAGDLAVIMQLLLNKGTYGGQRYLSEAVVEEFTKCQFCASPKSSASSKDQNRRGLGFDKPVRDGNGGPTCSCVSLASFGHTGFTGTMVWADPDEELIYVFLSNRIYPTALNKALIQMNIRTRIQEVVHDAVAGLIGEEVQR